MTLAEYISARGISFSAFAKELGVEVSTVTRIASRETVPSPKVMRKIIAATSGEVTPNSFFDLPREPGEEAA